MPRFTPPEPTDRLSRLAQLQGQDDSGGTGEILGLVKALSELYGIGQEKETMPAKLGLIGAQTRYQNTLADEYGTGRDSRALHDEAQALQAIFPAGVPPHIALALAAKMGYAMPEASKPQGEFGPGATAPTNGLAIPPEYANDPAFRALNPMIQSKQQDPATVAATKAEAKRQAELEKLRRKLGVDTTIMSGIPGALH